MIVSSRLCTLASDKTGFREYFNYCSKYTLWGVKEVNTK